MLAWDSMLSYHAVIAKVIPAMQHFTTKFFEIVLCIHIMSLIGEFSE